MKYLILAVILLAGCADKERSVSTPEQAEATPVFDYSPEPSVWDLEFSGVSCTRAYKQLEGNENYYTVDQPIQVRWLEYTPSSDLVQFDSCGAGEYYASTLEAYSLCDDPETEKNEALQIQVTVNTCGDNFHGLIEGRQGEKLFIKIIPDNSAALNTYYTIFINEIGE